MKILKHKRLIFTVIGVVLALFAIKAFFFFTAKPKVTVDYLAQYNEYAKPENFDPDKNAAPYYQKAFDAFIGLPDNLKHLDPWTDVNAQDKAMLEKWLASNAQAFDYFKKAVKKPYCWVERIPSDSPPQMGNFTPFEVNSYNDFTKALIWNIRIHADNQQFQLAFDNLLDCYRAGEHKCRPNLLLFEQLLGLKLKNTAIEYAYFLIDRYKIDPMILRNFQEALSAQFNSNHFVPSLQTQKFEAYDLLQRTFVDNGKGTGRLAWSAGWPKNMCGNTNQFAELKMRLQCCLFGPTKKEIEAQIDRILTQSDLIMQKTPWQVQNQDATFFAEIVKIENSHIFFAVSAFTINPKRLLNVYYQTNTQTEALITVLAILRYKNDTGGLPQSLNDLVVADYLKSVPNDPYSDKALIYKLTEDNFKLYSVGEDFTDDGGIISKEKTTNKTLSITIKSPDIVYWPVKIIEPEPIEFPMAGK